MNSIMIRWKKQSPNEIQFESNNKQYFQANSIKKIDNQGQKRNIKKVHFNYHPSINQPQAFENTQQYHSESTRSEEFIVQSPNVFTTKLSDVHAEPLCSVRGIISTFVIIVLIIIAVAIALGIVLGTIKSSSNVRGIVTDKITLNTSSTISSPIVMTSSIIIGSQSGPPCTSYTSIDDPSRNVTQIGLSGSCDNGRIFNTSNGGAWIRFVGSSGTIIALTAPGPNHCGGYIPVWFNDTLPTTIGIVTNGTLCMGGEHSSCIAAYTTPVIYCTGNFYVYFLFPFSFCNVRYCTQ